MTKMKINKYYITEDNGWAKDSKHTFGVDSDDNGLLSPNFFFNLTLKEAKNIKNKLNSGKYKFDFFGNLVKK